MTNVSLEATNISPQASEPSRQLQTEWPTPPTPRELDERFPGLVEPILGLGGAANIIMQLARPGVGYGVKESVVTSGSVFHRPFKRTRTTFVYLAVALLGTTEEKLAYRQAINGQHAKVYSTEKSPVRYNAFDPELQLWVAACLYFGMDDLYRRIFGELSESKAEELYQFAKPLGTTLQVPPDMWPENRAAFYAYWQRELEKTEIDDTMRDYLDQIVDLKFLPSLLAAPHRRFNRFVTAAFLPQKLREQMRMQWSEKHERRFNQLASVLRFVSRITPRFLRLLPARLLLRDFRRQLRNGRPLV